MIKYTRYGRTDDYCPKGEIKSLINKKVDSFNAITELIDDSIDAGSTNIRVNIL